LTSFFFTIASSFKIVFNYRYNFFFIIVLALITIDLGAALSIVILEGYLKNFDSAGALSILGSSTSGFKSVSEGSFLRSDFGKL